VCTHTGSIIHTRVLSCISALDPLMRCNLLQCVAVCVAVHWSVLQCVALCIYSRKHTRVLSCLSVLRPLVRCSVLQCVVVRSSEVAACCSVYLFTEKQSGLIVHYRPTSTSVLQCVAECCRMLECVAVCCSVYTLKETHSCLVLH